MRTLTMGRPDARVNRQPRLSLSAIFLCCLACGVASGQARAQNAESPRTQATAPAVPSTQPAISSEQDALMATVVQVVGRARTAPVGTDPADREAWKPLAVGDQLGKGAVIRTSIRSSVTLSFADSTVALVESTSLVAIMDLARGRSDGAGTADAAATDQRDRLQMGLGYGAVRAGSADESRASSLTIETPNVVLSREGTRGIRLEYNAGTGAYRASLGESGRVNVRQTAGRAQGQSRKLAPGAFVTQSMARWIETEPFTREIVLQDRLSLSDGEIRFMQADRAAEALGRGIASINSAVGSRQQQLRELLPVPPRLPQPGREGPSPLPPPLRLQDGQFGSPTQGPRIGDVLRSGS